MNKSVAAKRVAVKGKKELYNNAGWDLVDAFEVDSLFAAKLDMKTLPVNLQQKSRAEITRIVKEKNSQRGKIQQNISSVNTKREIFIAEAKDKSATKAGNIATLETEIEKIIKQQANRFDMTIK